MNYSDASNLEFKTKDEPHDLTSKLNPIGHGFELAENEAMPSQSELEELRIMEWRENMAKIRNIYG